MILINRFIWNNLNDPTVKISYKIAEKLIILIVMLSMGVLMGCTSASSKSFPKVVERLETNINIEHSKAECHTGPARFLALWSTTCMIEVQLKQNCNLQNPEKLYNVLLQNVWSLTSRAIYMQVRVLKGEQIEQNWLDEWLPELQKGLVNGKYVGETSLIRDVGNGFIQAGRREIKQKFGSFPSKLSIIPEDLITCE